MQPGTTAPVLVVALVAVAVVALVETLADVVEVPSLEVALALTSHVPPPPDECPSVGMQAEASVKTEASTRKRFGRNMIFSMGGAETSAVTEE